MTKQLRLSYAKKLQEKFDELDKKMEYVLAYIYNNL